MSFGSPLFIFVFFPLFYLVFFAAPQSWRNAIIFVASVLFYWADAGGLAWVLLASVLVNHVLAGILRDAQHEGARKALLTVGILINLLPLLYYKYWSFIIGELPASTAVFLKSAGIPVDGIFLPAGISFFTFQGISYLFDIYRREVAPSRSLVDFGMYHTMFPQLIAGPIVRYSEVAQFIRQRTYDVVTVHNGVVLFCAGLGTKIILADNAGAIADKIFALPPTALSFADAWLGIFAYTLQIFFDFSGYSTMAIGLGLMLGFRFPQNFDQPYRSQNITEFWRKWHMTLSRWFRDYLYIPLGGNRGGPFRTYVNLTLVFLLCGLWHGAAVTFVVWGLWHGVLLVVERVLQHRFGWRPAGLAGWALTMLLVMIGWVFFRSPTIDFALRYIAALSSVGGIRLSDPIWLAMTPGRTAFLIVAAVLAVLPFNPARLHIPSDMRPLALIGINIASLVVLLYALSLIAANGFNPFIYFRF
jgi:alginate O-acetyltransferase complex protein AlgI